MTLPKGSQSKGSYQIILLMYIYQTKADGGPPSKYIFIPIQASNSTPPNMKHQLALIRKRILHKERERESHPRKGTQEAGCTRSPELSTTKILQSPWREKGRERRMEEVSRVILHLPTTQSKAQESERGQEEARAKQKNPSQRRTGSRTRLGFVFR